ncbi:hypothetical protein FN846DRAFT_922445 [Sphaerosporella brunnea]|uniref:Uncharacterized protein n=1 Tax=Sphaerosporella brunnea TaxID=1250544 RepID=A0A5J5EJJ6_9PEZI|nr:hypothetical protein FN846DRAFT_922445 [Sphaerosporella brunnea]
MSLESIAAVVPIAAAMYFGVRSHKTPATNHHDTRRPYTRNTDGENESRLVAVSIAANYLQAVDQYSLATPRAGLCPEQREIIAARARMAAWDEIVVAFQGELPTETPLLPLEQQELSLRPQSCLLHCQMTGQPRFQKKPRPRAGPIHRTVFDEAIEADLPEATYSVSSPPLPPELLPALPPLLDLRATRAKRSRVARAGVLG